MAALNYAKEYQQALEQAGPLVKKIRDELN